MTKKREENKHRVWLPPIDLCCEKCSFHFSLFLTLEIHLALNCPVHGYHLIKNPLKKSRYRVEIIPSRKFYGRIIEHLTPEERAKISPKILEHYKKKGTKL